MAPSSSHGRHGASLPAPAPRHTTISSIILLRKDLAQTDDIVLGIKWPFQCQLKWFFCLGYALYRGNEYSLWWKFASREQPLRRKIHNQFLCKYIRRVVRVFLRNAEMARIPKLRPPILIGTHYWLTSWDCRMPSPSRGNNNNKPLVLYNYI